MVIDEKIRLDYQYISNEIFIFSEGATFINRLTTERAQDIKYIIHPLFKEYLNLYNNTNSLVCHYSWEYLKELEGIMHANNRNYLLEL